MMAENEERILIYTVISVTMLKPLRYFRTEYNNTTAMKRLN